MDGWKVRFINQRDHWSSQSEATAAVFQIGGSDGGGVNATVVDMDLSPWFGRILSRGRIAHGCLPRGNHSPRATRREGEERVFHHNMVLWRRCIGSELRDKSERELVTSHELKCIAHPFSLHIPLPGTPTMRATKHVGEKTPSVCVFTVDYPLPHPIKEDSFSQESNGSQTLFPFKVDEGRVTSVPTSCSLLCCCEV